MPITQFEDIYSWQKSQDLAVDIYKIFKVVHDRSFRDQICRAVVSISNNVAEGFDLDTNRQFTRHLYIARGSAAEVRSMLYLAQRLGYITEAQKQDLIPRSREISRLLRGFIKSIEKK